MEICVKETKDPKLLAELNHDVQEIHANIEPEIFKRFDKDEMEGLFKEILEEQEASAYVAYYNGQAAGYILLAKKEYRETAFKYGYSALYIDQICVQERFRGKEIGKALMEKAKSVSQETGINRIELDFWYKNMNAGQFFRTQGFETYNEKMFLML
ncbi:MAG: GNAT family N-acetyltransferase [Bacillota bacterium]